MSSLPDVVFPVDFRDVHYLALTYTSSFDAVNKKLNGTGLKVGLIFNGKPLIAVALIEYKDSDLGAYNEVIIAIPVVPNEIKSSVLNWLDLYAPLNTRKLGQYIIHIPVTSEKSMLGGRDLWGYPKIVRKIIHSFEKNKIDFCVLNEECNQNIIEFKGSLGMGLPVSSMDLMTYSYLQEQILKTTVNVRSNMRWKPFADIRITANDTNDPMCKDIIDLGICNKKPLFTIEATKFKAKFNEGIKLL
jgi:hypothetical protein